MRPKVFINDSVYNSLAIGIFDVAKGLFANGFLGILDDPFRQNVANGPFFGFHGAPGLRPEILITKVKMSRNGHDLFLLD